MIPKDNTFADIKWQTGGKMGYLIRVRFINQIYFDINVGERPAHSNPMHRKTVRLPYWPT